MAAFFIRYRRELILLAVFIVSFAFFTYLQYSPTFADPDSFYHAKMAMLIRDEGIIRDFPWLRYTTLSTDYIDQHFLYHVALIPFVSLAADPIIGVKVATAFFAAALVTVFAWLLLTARVRLPYLFILVLLVTNPFIFRVSLAKAPAVSLIAALLGLFFLFKRNWRVLFFLSFAYVWLYGGFIVILLLAGFVWFVDLAALAWHALHRRLTLRLSSIGRMASTKSLAAVAAGLLVGLILNPFFPKNLTFLWQQLVQIGIVNYQATIGVGAEWYPYAAPDIVSGNAFTVTLFVIGLMLLLTHAKRGQRSTWALLLISLFFLAFTLKSRRYIEYYVPFTLLFSAFAIRDSLPHLNLRELLGRVKRLAIRQTALATILTVYFLITLTTVAFRDVLQARTDLRYGNGLRYDTFEPSMRWLQANSSRRSIVLHSDWDEFPLLFYHNDWNTYIVGLDATFMYRFDPDLYRTWVDITTGNFSGDLYATITDDFRASFVFLTKDHTAMDSLVLSADGLTLVYEDSETKIYRVEPQRTGV